MHCACPRRRAADTARDPAAFFSSKLDVRLRHLVRLLLCRFLDAGMTRLSARSGGRRPKTCTLAVIPSMFVFVEHAISGTHVVFISLSTLNPT
jgi:hypothetical protein